MAIVLNCKQSILAAQPLFYSEFDDETHDNNSYDNDEWFEQPEYIAHILKRMWPKTEGVSVLLEQSESITQFANDHFNFFYLIMIYSQCRDVFSVEHLIAQSKRAVLAELGLVDSELAICVVAGISDIQQVDCNTLHTLLTSSDRVRRLRKLQSESHAFHIEALAANFYFCEDALTDEILLMGKSSDYLNLLYSILDMCVELKFYVFSRINVIKHLDDIYLMLENEQRIRQLLQDKSRADENTCQLLCDV